MDKFTPEYARNHTCERCSTVCGCHSTSCRLCVNCWEVERRLADYVKSEHGRRIIAETLGIPNLGELGLLQKLSRMVAKDTMYELAVCNPQEAANHRAELCKILDELGLDHS